MLNVKCRNVSLGTRSSVLCHLFASTNKQYLGKILRHLINIYKTVRHLFIIRAAAAGIEMVARSDCVHLQLQPLYMNNDR